MIGYVVLNTGRSCTQCREGTYERNNTECIGCLKGYVASAGSSGSCKQCVTGTLLHSFILLGLIVFVIGFNISLSECWRCEANTSWNYISMTCIACPSGSYSLPDSINCTKCPNGVPFYYMLFFLAIIYILLLYRNLWRWCWTGMFCLSCRELCCICWWKVQFNPFFLFIYLSLYFIMIKVWNL